MFSQPNISFWLAKLVSLGCRGESIVGCFRAGGKAVPTRTLRQGDLLASAAADGARQPGEAGGIALAQPAGNVSLEGVHGTVKLPDHKAGFWKQWWAFSGPAILVSVGYMDPGNWGTDLQAGAQYKFGLLWVVGLASVMAIFMQVIAARLGVVTGKDLAQCCRDWYPRWMRWPNWLLCEVAIGACDLAEVLGSAVALNLMFHIPLLWAVIITGLDVLLLLGLQRFGMRTIEAVVLLLVAILYTDLRAEENLVAPPTIRPARRIGRSIPEGPSRPTGTTPTRRSTRPPT